MNNLKLHTRKTIVDKIVCVDGFARTGKHLHIPIISSFKEVLPWKLTQLIDSLPYLLFLKKIDRELALETLKREVDHFYFDGHLARDVNFRADDLSSVWNTGNPKEFFLKMFDTEDENSVMEKIIQKKSQKVFHLVSHDVLATGEAKLFFDAWPDLKMLNSRRHPVDVIYSAIKKGWGHRMGRDPKSFWLAFNIDESKEPLPWWAVEWGAEFFELSEVDRLVKAFEYCFKREEKSKQTLKQEHGIEVRNLFFERACSETEAYLEELESFLPSQRSLRTPTILEEQRVPRKLLKEDFEMKKDFLTSHVGQSFKPILIDLSERYEESYRQSYGSSTMDLRV